LEKKLSLPAGTYDLTFYFEERVSTTKDVEIKTGVATNVSTEMRPIDPNADEGSNYRQLDQRYTPNCGVRFRKPIYR
jgi:hypothetical protein